MSGTSSIIEDRSRLSALDRALFKFESFLALVGGSLILVLMFLAVAQILGRKFLDMPVLGFIDLVEQAMAVFAFMGIAYCQRLGGHIRMDIVVGVLKGRALWAVEIISVVFMLLLTGALTLGSWFHFKRAFDNGDSSIDIGIPLWPAKLLVPLALSILALRLLVQLWGYTRAFLENAEKPVAVPLIESAAEQAAHEADALHGEEDDTEGEGKTNGSA